MYLMFNEQPAELTININAVKLFQTTLTSSIKGNWASTTHSKLHNIRQTQIYAGRNIAVLFFKDLVGRACV